MPFHLLGAPGATGWRPQPPAAWIGRKNTAHPFPPDGGCRSAQRTQASWQAWRFRSRPAWPAPCRSSAITGRWSAQCHHTAEGPPTPLRYGGRSWSKSNSSAAPVLIFPSTDISINRAVIGRPMAASSFVICLYRFTIGLRRVQ